MQKMVGPGIPMKTIEPCSTPPRTRRARKYQNLSLVELAEHIVRCSDREALRELHDHRPLFRLRDSVSLLFVDFVDLICSSLWASRFANGNMAILDRARDLTVDKFSNLPDSNAPPTGRRNGGPDCRNYFRTFLNLWTKTAQIAGPLNTWRRRSPPSSFKTASSGASGFRVWRPGE